MPHPPTPQDLVEHALATTGSRECVVVARARTSANLRWAGNTLTTNGETRGATVTVIALAEVRAPDGTTGTGVGSVTGTAATRAQVDALVAQADAAAATAAPAQDAAPLIGGPDAPLPGAAGALVDPDWADEPEVTSIGVYADFAPALGEAFARAGAGGRVLYGFVDHQVVTTYLGSSTGLRRRHVQPTGHHGCTGKTADLQRSAWVGGATRDVADVDAHAMEATLEQRLGWGAQAYALPAGRYDTLVPPGSVADLMIDAYWSAGARVAHEGQSVWSRRGGGTRIGERVARPGVRLLSDPAWPGLECAPFVEATSSGNTESVFDNGLPLGRTAWIDDGVLAALLQTRHSAGLTGQPVTPAVDNLVLEVDGATGGIEQLVAGTERGLLLTCLWYIREVDAQTLLLTGLTRDGVYLVEGGEVVGAVNNFRFNESPVDLLQRFSHASATEPCFSREWGDDYFSRTAMPALRIPDFNMSSVSQAL